MLSLKRRKRTLIWKANWRFSSSYLGAFFLVRPIASRISIVCPRNSNRNEVEGMMINQCIWDLWAVRRLMRNDEISAWAMSFHSQTRRLILLRKKNLFCSNITPNKRRNDKKFAGLMRIRRNFISFPRVCHCRQRRGRGFRWRDAMPKEEFITSDPRRGGNERTSLILPKKPDSALEIGSPFHRSSCRTICSWSFKVRRTTERRTVSFLIPFHS